MPERNPIKFLTNEGADAGTTGVVAPAFSLTKVLASAAIIIGPIATLIVNKVGDVDFSPGQIVALALGLLGFLAIVTAADVIARAIAAAAGKRAKATQAGFARTIIFSQPLPSELKEPAGRAVIALAVAQGDEDLYLIREEEKLRWLPAAELDLAKWSCRP